MRTALDLTALLTVLSFVYISCGGSPHRAYRPGTSTGQPNLRTLPQLDVSHSLLTPRMKKGWSLALEYFRFPAFVMPAARDAQALQVWTDTEVKDWASEKNKRLQAATKELNRASEESLRQRVVAAAVIALMNEDMVRALWSIPIPKELEQDREIVAVYRDVIESRAEPYLKNARRTYRACAYNAREIETLRHWSRFCGERGFALPVPRRELTSGSTAVTVFSD